MHVQEGIQESRTIGNKVQPPKPRYSLFHTSCMLELTTPSLKTLSVTFTRGPNGTRLAFRRRFLCSNNVLLHPPTPLLRDEPLPSLVNFTLHPSRLPSTINSAPASLAPILYLPPSTTDPHVTQSPASCSCIPSQSPSSCSCIPSLTSRKSCHIYTLTPKFTLVIIVCLLALSLLNTVNAIHSLSTFSIYSLNANGLGHAVKLQHINTAIRSAKPHVFILNESKTKASIIKDLPHNDYEILEECTVKCQGNSHLYKWGTVLGIRNDLQVQNRVSISDPALLGRVLAADIAIQMSNGQAFNHRIIGVYAPLDPGSPDSLNFWPTLTNFIQTSNVDSWSLAGDLNATINSNERASGGADARAQYLKFLSDTNTIDLWSLLPE
ncbi:hypothetical protein BDP27DRAFT_1419525 [Rhodocollybia butyracea]|uniref:Endonuclease/exonuclease/phosphatase domain-containing protein n=1 Tax=Rhodocollybia butyracea TaxID=206335 RepID=A0A9P5U8I2_9AGAR|nr:hypothetical protein BDP27DRAFT_1419525 [Rhodocollybia butyracea]